MAGWTTRRFERVLGLWTGLFFYLAAAICASEILLTLTPSKVGPMEKMTLNCSFSTNFSDGALLYFSDQEGAAIAVFKSGDVPQAMGDYSHLISNLHSPDVTKKWASGDFLIPSCYKLKTIKCTLMAPGEELQDDQAFQIYRVSSPDLYYNNTCLTCAPSTDPLPPLYLSPNTSSRIECRLDGVTEIVELSWSEGFQLVKGTNLTYRDGYTCTYNHTSTAYSPDIHEKGRRDVTCTAMSLTGQFKSATVQVISGTDDSTIAPDKLTGEEGSPGWLVPVIVIPCVVIVLAVIFVVIVIYKRRNRKEEPKIHYREVVMKTDH